MAKLLCICVGLTKNPEGSSIFCVDLTWNDPYVSADFGVASGEEIEGEKDREYEVEVWRGDALVGFHEVATCPFPPALAAEARVFVEKLKTSAKVATCVLQEIVATQTLLIEARAVYVTM